MMIQRDATITVSGLAVLFSPAVGDVIGSLPDDAKLSPLPPDIVIDGRTDSTFHARGGVLGPEFTVSGASDVSACVQWFSNTLETSIRNWFAQRDSLEKLVKSQQHRSDSWFEKNIPPTRPPTSPPASRRPLRPPTYIDAGSAEVFRNEDVEFTSQIWASGG
ncbi:hypothetical protein ACWF82_28760 [Nocardia sp. NPDC055053]